MVLLHRPGDEHLGDVAAFGHPVARQRLMRGRPLARQRAGLVAERLDDAAEGAGAEAPGERALLERRLLLRCRPEAWRWPLGEALAL